MFPAPTTFRKPPPKAFRPSLGFEHNHPIMTQKISENLLELSNWTRQSAARLNSRPITSILSLCMVLAIGATIAGFSQVAPTGAPTGSPTTAAVPTTLPVARTVTDTTGRKLEGTILSKDGTSIKFRRTSDGKEFDLTLDRLSTEDQAFIAGLVTPPVKKPTVLLERKEKTVQALLEAAGFDVTILSTVKRFEDIDGKPAATAHEYPDLDKLTDDEIKNFDIIWVIASMETTKQKDRFLQLIPACKVVVWRRNWKISKAKLLSNETTQESYTATTQEYIKSDGNVVFYNSENQKWNAKDGTKDVIKTHSEILEQAVAEAKKLMTTN